MAKYYFFNDWISQHQSQWLDGIFYTSKWKIKHLLYFSWNYFRMFNGLQFKYSDLRIHWRLSTILKTSKKLYEVMIFDMWKYVYFESVFNTLYIEIKLNVKKISFRQKRSKKCPLFSFVRSNSSQFYF